MRLKIFGGKFLIKLLTLGLLVSFVSNVQAQFTISDDFRNQGSPDVVIGDNAYFTSGIDDPVGAGWLRLTKALGNQKGYAYINRSFPSTMGLIIDFEYTMWRDVADNTYNGADGLSVFLFDANYGPGTFALGAYGGSLGYANSTDSSPQSAGVTGGYVGVGFDAYGNFIRASEGKNGGSTGLSPNSVGLRGPTTGTSPTSPNTNRYLEGVTILNSGDIVNALSMNGTATHNQVDYNTVSTTRPSAATFYRRVQLEIIPAVGGSYRIVVRWAKTTAGIFTDLIDVTVADVPPELLKVGFAASTGGGYNYHEIRNLQITTPRNLRVSKRADKDVLRSIPAGTNANDITYTIEVTNDTDEDYTDATFEDQLLDINGDPIPTSMFTINSITSSNFESINISPVSGENRITGGLTIGPNKIGTITVTGTLHQIPPSNVLINRVDVMPAAGNEDFDLGNNTAIVRTPVIAEDVDLLVNQTLGQDCLDPVAGNTISSIVTNMGMLPALYGGFTVTGSSSSDRPYERTRVEVTRIVPPNVTMQPINNTGWTLVATQNNTPQAGYTSYIYRTNVPGTVGSTWGFFTGYTITNLPHSQLTTGLSLPPLDFRVTGSSAFEVETKVRYIMESGRVTRGSGTSTTWTFGAPTNIQEIEPIENLGNNSTTSLISTVEDAPVLPNSTINYYVGDVASQLAATALPGHSLIWYLNVGGVPATVAPTPFTTTAGTTTYYVSQTNGSCEGPLAQITVIVQERTADLYTDIVYSINANNNASTGNEGDAIIYQVTAGSQLSSDLVAGALFTFRVPPGVNIANTGNPGAIAYTTDCPGSGGSVTVSPLTYDAATRTFSSALTSLSPGCSITYSFVGTINGTHGSTIAESTILRPKFVKDPDATSNILADPLDPFIECNVFNGGSCNNIDVATFIVIPPCSDEIIYFEDFGNGNPNLNNARENWENRASIRILANGTIAGRTGPLGGATATYTFAPGKDDPTFSAANGAPHTAQSSVSRIKAGYYSVNPPGYLQRGIPETDPWSDEDEVWYPGHPAGFYDWTASWYRSDAIRDMSGGVNGNAFLIRGSQAAIQSVRPFYEFDVDVVIADNETYTLDLFSYVTYTNKTYMLMDVIDKTTGFIYASVPLENITADYSTVLPTGVAFGWNHMSASFSFPEDACDAGGSREIRIAIRGNRDIALETGNGFGHTLLDNITFSKRLANPGCAIDPLTISCADNCHEDINMNGEQWASGERTFTIDATDDGFAVDVFKVDHSQMSLIINEGDAISVVFSGANNVRFISDGNIWGTAGIDPISSINSGATIDYIDRHNNPTPVFRLVMDASGNIRIFGKRSSAADMEEMEFISPVLTQHWITDENATEDNSVKITSQNIAAIIYGLEVKECETCIITKDGALVVGPADRYVTDGEEIVYTFEIENLGDMPIYDLSLADNKLFQSPIDFSNTSALPAFVEDFAGDNNNNGILDRNETWTFKIRYQVTNADIFVNRGVYNLATITALGKINVASPPQLNINVDSVDPTPYDHTWAGWDPTRPFHTFVFLKGQGKLITNPMIRQRVIRNNE